MSEPVAYIGRNKDRKALYAVVDDDKPRVAKLVSDWIRSGMTIERVPCQWGTGAFLYHGRV